MAAHESPDSNHWFHNRWTTLGIFTLLFLVCYIDRFVLGALLTPIKDALHITDEKLGRLNTVFVIAYIAVIPLAGFLGDRFSRKWYVFGALLLWSFASIGSGWAATFGSLLVWRALVGLGEGIFSGIAPGWIADIFGPKLRSLAFAVIMSTGQIGAWIAYHYGGKIAESGGWSQAFFVAGVPGLVLVLAVIFLREPKPGSAEEKAQPAVETKADLSEVLAFLKQPDYLLYVSAYSIRMLAVSGLFFWGAVFLHREFGVGNKDATSFMGSAYLLAGTPGIFLAGYLAGKWAARYRGVYATWIAAGELLSGISVAFALLAAGDLKTVQILLLCQMFFAGNSWGVINPLLFEIAPFRLRSIAVSVSLGVSTGISTLLYAQVIGLVSDHYGIRAALLLVPSAYFIASSLWLILALRQKRAKIGDESPEVSGIPQPPQPTPA